MKELTAEKFHPLWDRNYSLLGADDNEKKAWTNFSEFKTITVESFLETLIGDADFEKMRPLLPEVALSGLINASHFVALSRLDDSIPANEPQNANDLVFDKKRNIITRDRLRLAMGRQCAIIMPPNSFAYDAIIPICLPIEFVIDSAGKTSINPINLGFSNGVPIELYNSNPSKYKGQSRYRPIYSFLGIKFKSGGFEAAALSIMDPRLHFVPCPVHGYYLNEDCRHCEEEEALKEIFKNHISLLYCFKDRAEVQKSMASSFSVNFGREKTPSTSSHELFKALYPKLAVDQIEAFVEENLTLRGDEDYRTFEDYYLKHSEPISESVDLVNFLWNESVGNTYKNTDLEAYEAKLKKHKDEKLKWEKELISSLNEMDFNASLQENDSSMEGREVGKKSAGILSAPKSSSKKSRIVPSIGPVMPIPPEFPLPIEFFDLDKLPESNAGTPLSRKDAAKRPNFLSEARMSTIVLYGWEKWAPFIGQMGAELAKKMLDEFNFNSVRNVDKYDLPALAPSLKVFMSSKLVGVDQYECPEESKYTIDKWIPLVQTRLKRYNN